eukprot:TRINITY_DN3332_c0_g2_i5.p3 TRINITY_DN3332_c0_g2~~TRINITY_DN3332_c0_g2_i5.p3  ORF type:complete len:118 (-),score=17.13 TRINITY_DN3332_c0_g2_i5:1277-1630(-)
MNSSKYTPLVVGTSDNSVGVRRRALSVLAQYPLSLSSQNMNQQEQHATERFHMQQQGTNTALYDGSVGTGQGGHAEDGNRFRTDKFAVIDEKSTGKGGGYTPTTAEARKVSDDNWKS